MFDHNKDGYSLDKLTRYELVLNHCFEKLGVTDRRWRHADAFSATIDYARKSGYLNAKNELTTMGNMFASMQRFVLREVG